MQEPMKYGRFVAMVVVATVIMFGLMYLNTLEASHVRWSQTRMWMAFVMGAVMATVMLAFMLGMYTDRRKNALVFGVSVVVFVGALYLVRSQRTVDDVAWMKAMIPHHSIAILTSERADIRDARARQLAREIIEAQRREIDEMERLIEDIESNGVRLAVER